MVADICIILALLFFALRGYKKGFVKSVYSIVSLAASFVIMALFGSSIIGKIASSSLGISIGEFLAENISDNVIIEKCSSAIIYFVSSVIMYIAVKFFMKFALNILNKIASIPFISSINKFLGLAVGLMFGIVWIVVGVNVLNSIPKTETFVLSSQIVSFFGLLSK